MIWVSRVLAAVTVIIGPALLVFGRSDLGPWTPWSETVLLSVPFAFHAFAAFGYVVATGVTRPDASALRTTIAAIGCLLIPFVAFALSLPLLFGLGESDSGNDLAAGIGCGVLALPTAAFQVLVTRRRIAVSILEFLSHPGTTGAALFSQSLREAGWVEGKNLRTEVRWAGDNAERFHQYARELAGSVPDSA
jgi:hypothetical protein